MTTITVLRGGSGRWQLDYDKLPLAWGHVPKRASFKEVCTRQIKRQANGEIPGGVYPNLRGGSLIEVSLADEEIEVLKTRAIRLRKDREHTALSHLGRETCKICGATYTFRHKANGVEVVCPTSWEHTF